MKLQGWVCSRLAALAFAACQSGATPAPSGAASPSAAASSGASPSAAASGGATKGTVKIAIELPLQGSEKAASRADHQRHPPRREAGRRRRRRLHDRGPGLGDLRRRPQRRARSADRRQQHDQGRRRPGHRRGHRPAQLERRQGADPDLERGRPAPVLAGQHEPGPDQGRAGQADPPVGQAEQLHPRRHHGRRPGPGRGAVHLRRAQEELRLHHRRHRDLR